MEAVEQYDPGRRSLVGQFGSRRACAHFRFRRIGRPLCAPAALGRPRVQHLVCTGSLFSRDAARPLLKDIVASLRSRKGHITAAALSRPRRFPSPLSTHFGVISLRAWLAAARVCSAGAVRRARAYFLLRRVRLCTPFFSVSHFRRRRRSPLLALERLSLCSLFFRSSSRGAFFPLLSFSLFRPRVFCPLCGLLLPPPPSLSPR